MAHAGRILSRPLVAHVLYRFSVGGLENGVVNLINHLPQDRFRHAIIALTEVSDLRTRIRRDDVAYIALKKRPGHTATLFPRLFRLFRELEPANVHTRNLAALECQLPAWLAGVRGRVHGEHGWDMSDLVGSNQAYRWLRRGYRPFVQQYIALSKNIEEYLSKRIGIPPARVTQIYNGVDIHLFHPAPDGRVPLRGSPFDDSRLWVIGTVGRLQPVKDQINLARAFVAAVQGSPEARRRLRLTIVGDGPLRHEIEAVLHQAGVQELAWLPGERDDVPALMRALDCFVLPSRAEGISNTILEAMASGLPVVATAVGGNPELVAAGRSGRLVPPADPRTLAASILDYFSNPDTARQHGIAGRARAVTCFSLDAMVSAYGAVYDTLLRGSRASA